MKKFSLLILIIFPLFILISCSSSSVINSVSEKKNIAFISRGRNGYYLESIKNGADIASKEFNVNVEYSFPEDEEDTDGQIKLVSRAIEEKVDAIILSPIDYKACVDIINKAIDKNIPVIITDCEINTSRINSFIGTDNYNAGIKAGEKLVEMLNKYGNVAIMGYVYGTPTGDKREKGILDVISKYPHISVIDKKYCSSDSNLASILTKAMITNNKNIDAIIALNGTAAEGVADAVKNMGLESKVKIIAFDSNPKEIEYVESGVIQAMVIQNPLSIGYLGVKSAYQVIDGQSIPKFIDTGSKIIDKENMYLPENQKLIFPFVK